MKDYNLENTFIAIIHSGKSWYLPFVLHQISHIERYYNLVVIGDNLDSEITDSFNTFDLNLLESEQIRDLKSHYKHMSSNNREYELFCFLRWFYLKEYMIMNEFENVLYLDSDILLYSSLKDIIDVYGDDFKSNALLFPDKNNNLFQEVVPGSPLFWDINMLSEFCSFILESYKDKRQISRYEERWLWLQKNQLSGGVSDMTALYMFWNKRQKLFLNLAKPYRKTVFDANINLSSNYLSEEYEMLRGIKRIKFKKNKPYVQKIGSDFLIMLHCIHFQGRAKIMIPDFYIGPNFLNCSYKDFFIIKWFYWKGLIGRKFPFLKEIKSFLNKIILK